MINTIEKWVQSLIATLAERERGYGSPLANFINIGLYWTRYLGNKLMPDKVISPVDVAILMMLMKIAREEESHKEDNLTDIAGYVLCLIEIDRHIKQLKDDPTAGVDTLQSMTQAELQDLYERMKNNA